LIRPIVQRMETQLSEPDAVIIEQYSEGNAIYLISKGQCLVIVSEDSQFKGSVTSASKGKKADDEKKKEEKILRPGYLFGEISIVYNCLTTATVQAKKYCNLGKLTMERYREIITIQPKIQEEIKTGIYEYNDKMLNFIKRSMKQVPYF
jgi:CRP-like cAMP-binding protein